MVDGPARLVSRGLRLNGIEGASSAVGFHHPQGIPRTSQGKAHRHPLRVGEAHFKIVDTAQLVFSGSAVKMKLMNPAWRRRFNVKRTVQPRNRVNGRQGRLRLYGQGNTGRVAFVVPGFQAQMPAAVGDMQDAVARRTAIQGQRIIRVNIQLLKAAPAGRLEYKDFHLGCFGKGHHIKRLAENLPAIGVKTRAVKSQLIIYPVGQVVTVERQPDASPGRKGLGRDIACSGLFKGNDGRFMASVNGAGRIQRNKRQ